MNKNAKTNTKGKTTGKGKGKTDAPARATLEWYTGESAYASVRKLGENSEIFDLIPPTDEGPAATLRIFYSDNDYDNAILDIFGVSIRCSVRQGNAGMFLSLPSTKKKDGSYFDLVTVYDKAFHGLMKDLLSLIYSDESTADE